MTKKQILLGILAILSSITLVILLVIFDSHIISFFLNSKLFKLYYNILIFGIKDYMIGLAIQ